VPTGDRAVDQELHPGEDGTEPGEGPQLTLEGGILAAPDEHEGERGQDGHDGQDHRADAQDARQAPEVQVPVAPPAGHGWEGDDDDEVGEEEDRLGEDHSRCVEARLVRVEDGAGGEHVDAAQGEEREQGV
jgi:hypothetical protein